EATPNGNLAEPEDIAAAIAFFLSREAGHITGQVLRVDGGMSLSTKPVTLQ
ncbi:MAG: SDR family oxidoreductase, partial [Maritimibacter sp.]|nr:SDR family oxidoreductase [Maritimibacter sp.]